MKIGIQGVLGSYHHQAAVGLYGESVEITPYETFRDLFDAVDREEVDGAMAAIENSIFGTIQETYRLIELHRFWVDGQITLPIKHQLIGMPGASLKDIKFVHSQSMAIEQCRYTLTEALPEVKFIEETDTALSVSIVKELGDKTHAAAASALSSEIYGMAILLPDVQDQDDNATRFISVKKHMPILTDEQKPFNKSMVRLVTGNASGSLYRSLGVFANRDINITKLESWPVESDIWHYSFYLDLDIGSDSETYREILEELTAQGCDLQLIGSFKI